MSRFVADWLALREPADHRARAVALVRTLRRWVHSGAADRRTLRVVDLGAGTGSNLRALAPHLPGQQAWMLIDLDATLLAAAMPSARGSRIGMRRHAGNTRVQTMITDLAAPAALAKPLRQGNLFTAAAFFDLVSEAWCRRLLRMVATPGVALYAALTYDGQMTFTPAEPMDDTIRSLFNAHQRRDKGFGPALGPTAGPVLARLAASFGATVRTARSSWRLGPGQEPLLAALLWGWASAAQESAPAHGERIAAWTERRARQLQSGDLRVVVGHRDVLAIW